MNDIELTPKEKEALSNLKVGFNVIKEDTDVVMLSSKRVSVSQVWSKRLLKYSLYLNIVSIILYMIVIFLAFIEPTPDFYASTPSGKIVGPLPKATL